MFITVSGIYERSVLKNGGYIVTWICNNTNIATTTFFIGAEPTW